MRKKTVNSMLYFRLLVLAPLLLLCSFLTLFLVKFGGDFSGGFNEIEAWGQVGDYFGGVLNPILAYFSFLGVLYTVWLNKKFLAISNEELRLSREEMSRSTIALEEQNQQIHYQRLESTFFSLLSHLGNIAEDIIIDSKKLQERGIDPGAGFAPISGKLGLQEVLRLYYEARRQHPEASAQEVSILVFDRLDDLVDFYCDTVNVILHFLVSRRLEEADFYKKLLVAQMSTDELLLLFYYALRPQSAELRANITRSSILLSLSLTDLADPVRDEPCLRAMCTPP